MKARLRRAASIRLLPLATDLTARKRGILQASAASVVLTLIAYAMFVGFEHDAGPAVDSFFKTWLFSGILVMAATICMLRAAWVREDRVTWWVLGIGMALWALGTVYWSLFLKDMEAPPYPSVADLLYLSFYPAAYFALMLLVRKQLRGVGPSVWLDGLIGALSVGALELAFVVPRVLADTGGTTAVVVTNAAYPLGDLLLTALVAAMFALTGWRPGRKWLLIGAGLILLSVADTLYLYRVANDTFVEGTLLDAIWPAGMVLLALAAWQMPRQTATHAFEGWPVVVVPSIFTLGSRGGAAVRQPRAHRRQPRGGPCARGRNSASQHWCGSASASVRSGRLPRAGARRLRTSSPAWGTGACSTSAWSRRSRRQGGPTPR